MPSASSTDRFVHCAGSQPLIEEVRKFEEARKQEAKESKVAAEGTIIHQALEDDSFDELDMAQKEIAEAIAKMRVAAEEKWKLDNDLLREGLKFEEIREERFWIRDAEFNLLASAKPDYCVICRERDQALIINYKTGYKRSVSANVNWQCRLEALATWFEFPDLKRIRCVIAQHRFGSFETLVDYGLEDLQKAMSGFNIAVWQSRQPDAPRVPGRWCFYCPARGYCIEAACYATLTSSKLNEDMVAVAPLDVAANVWRRRSLTKSIMEAIDDRLKASSDNELLDVGIKKLPGVSVNKVNDIIGLYTLLAGAGLCDSKEFMGLFNGARMRGKLMDLVGERLGEMEKLPSMKAIGEHFDKMTARFTESTKGEPRLKDIKPS